MKGEATGATGATGATDAKGAKGGAACGARCSLVVALLTGGEGFHLGHHMDPVRSLRICLLIVF